MWADSAETMPSPPSLEGVRVLVASEDDELRAVAATALAGLGYGVVTADGLREARRHLNGARAIDAILLDAAAFEPALGFVDEILGETPHPEILVLADAPDDAFAVQAVRRGAHDLLGKPPSWEIADERLRRVLSVRNLRDTLSRVFREKSAEHAASSDFIFSPALARVAQSLGRAAKAEIPILLVGERGTPKLALARSVHQQSRRAHRPFDSVQCASLPDEELDRALFGSPSKGTDSGQSLFEQAHGGTLFLDDVHLLSERTQARLSRALEERAIFHPDGREINVDVRLVCSTDRDLKDAVEEGRFRPDLLYRLAGFSVTVPPLRERAEDLPGMTESTLARIAERDGIGPRGTSDEAARALVQYRWPGNDRELELVLARAALLATGDEVEMSALPSDLAHPSSNPAATSGAPVADEDGVLSFEEYERRALRVALEETGGNVTRAAQKLGIGRATFYRKAKKFGIRLS